MRNVSLSITISNLSCLKIVLNGHFEADFSHINICRHCHCVNCLQVNVRQSQRSNYLKRTKLCMFSKKLSWKSITKVLEFFVCIILHSAFHTRCFCKLCNLLIAADLKIFQQFAYSKSAWLQHSPNSKNNNHKPLHVRVHTRLSVFRFLFSVGRIPLSPPHNASG